MSWWWSAWIDRLSINKINLVSFFVRIVFPYSVILMTIKQLYKKHIISFPFQYKTSFVIMTKLPFNEAATICSLIDKMHCVYVHIFYSKNMSGLLSLITRSSKSIKDLAISNDSHTNQILYEILHRIRQKYQLSINNQEIRSTTFFTNSKCIWWSNIHFWNE